MANEIVYGFAETPFGTIIVARTIDGICDLQFLGWNRMKGETLSYQELAERVGQPKAVRAVASAVAENRIAMLIPCHRIIHKDGTTGEYHWGRELKKQLLEWEKE